jgi:putative heme-binding domain-containing protein
MLRASILLSAMTGAVLGQPPSDAAQQGAAQFRQDCVFCHGVNARGGVRGPDLTSGVWAHGGSDAEIARTINNGVPGTQMPANHLSDAETAQIIAYLRTQQQPAAAPVGEAHRGESLFFGGAKCSGCHMVGGRGGRLGPELTTVGSSRPRAYLVESVREPNRQLSQTPGVSGDLIYDTVVAVTRDGKTITGVAINEDTFTVQLMDMSERIQSLDKKSLKSIRHEHRSLMPAYTADLLNENDLNDVVAYLQSLRAPTPAAEKGATRGEQ